MSVTLLLLEANGVDEFPLPENAYELEYYEREVRHVFYQTVPKYIHKHGEYYERIEEKIPSYSWEEWLKEGELHELVPDELNLDWYFYYRYFPHKGWAVTFNTVEEMFEYLVSIEPVSFEDEYKMLDGTSLVGIKTYYDW